MASDHDPALIEKAAKALYERDNGGTGWEIETDAVRRMCRSDARAVLDAVADDLRAKAWTKGYVAGWDDRHEDEDNPLPAGEQHDTPNPYRKEADRG